MRQATVLPMPMRAWRWAHRRLFDGWVNILLGLASLALLAVVLPPLWRWLVTDSRFAPADYDTCLASGGACWAFLQAKWRLILFGTFPYDEQWRPAWAVALFIGMVLLSAWRGAWVDTARRRAMGLAWLLVMAAIVVLMHGGVFGLLPVQVRLWSGLPLTLGLAVVGCISAFGFAILLALGRRSELPLLRWVSVAYIEFIRGVPLVGLLFLATILFPLIMPPNVDVDKLLRAQLAFVMFLPTRRAY